MEVPYRLTPREVEVLQAACDVGSPPKIGALLGISPYTVNAHLQSARTKSKLGIRQLMVEGLRDGWLH